MNDEAYTKERTRYYINGGPGFIDLTGEQVDELNGNREKLQRRIRNIECAETVQNALNAHYENWIRRYDK
jgi:hypothetical protein